MIGPTDTKQDSTLESYLDQDHSPVESNRYMYVPGFFFFFTVLPSTPAVCENLGNYVFGK